MDRNTLESQLAQLLGRLPEPLLRDMLPLLEALAAHPEDATTAHRLRLMLEEDKELLERLAQ